MRLGEARVDHHRDRHADIRQGQLVLAQKVDAKGAVVDRDELLGLLQRARRHLKGWKTADRDRAVKRPFDVLRRDGRTVMKLGAAA
jgi:hypothetical protein